MLYRFISPQQVSCISSGIRRVGFAAKKHCDDKIDETTLRALSAELLPGKSIGQVGIEPTTSSVAGM
jgi:hypothetical protein